MRSNSCASGLPAASAKSARGRRGAAERRIGAPRARARAVDELARLLRDRGGRGDEPRAPRAAAAGGGGERVAHERSEFVRFRAARVRIENGEARYVPSFSYG